MLETIEKLLILQERDRRLQRLRGELVQIEPERQALRAKAADAQKALENAKEKVKQLESDRKNLELEVEAQKQLIAKYSLQQFQTRKNEEYRALAHEIETCKAAIVRVEDQELELMEQAEVAQKDAARASKASSDSSRLADDQLAQLSVREQKLKQELMELEANRETIALT